MASGCILGTCWVCNELIWENEPWEIYKDDLIHRECKSRAGGLNKRIKELEEKVNKLECESNKRKKLKKSFRLRLIGGKEHG